MAIADFGVGQREATGTREGRIATEFVVDGFGFGRPTTQGHAEEGFVEGEEALGRATGLAPGSDAGTQALGVDMQEGLRPEAGFEQSWDVVVEGGTREEQTLGGLSLGFRVGRGVAGGAGASLRFIELPECFVIVGGEREKRLPIEMTEDVKPEDIGLVFEEPVVGLDDMDEGQLDGGRVKR